VGRTSDSVILNRQRRVAVSLAPLERFWEQVRQTLHLPEDSMTICLVSDAEIARLNRAYRSKEGPTDVLSFPTEEAPPRRSGLPRNGSRRPARAKPPKGEPAAIGRQAADYLGDIAIAPAVARRNARRMGRSLPRELRILMLHGALHLLGYDHERDHGEMERLERRLRRRLGLGGR
jgi:probable rRNA maturation factor